MSSEKINEAYDIAQICMNGHLINENMQKLPLLNRDYCEKCGERTISKCSHCDSPIRGSDFGGEWVYFKPSYCHNCGCPFPWIVRNIQAAVDLSKEEERLTRQDVEQLESSMKNIVVDTPETKVAAARIRRLIEKAGKHTGPVIKEIVINVASEAAQRIILGK